MESMYKGEPGLVDLLDRVLNTGLVLSADVLICLKGVPLLGLNLRAALAGIETMVNYGFFAEWQAVLGERGDDDGGRQGPFSVPVGTGREKRMGTAGQGDQGPDPVTTGRS